MYTLYYKKKATSNRNSTGATATKPPVPKGAWGYVKSKRQSRLFKPYSTPDKITARVRCTHYTTKRKPLQIGTAPERQRQSPLFQRGFGGMSKTSGYSRLFKPQTNTSRYVITIRQHRNNKESHPGLGWLKEAATYFPTGEPQYHRR